MLGPALVAAIAYVDPGNIATNTAAGADSGYRLLWVVVLASVIAVVVQYLAAKLGMATDRNLAQQFRRDHSRTASRIMWVQAEVVAMATDLAEFVGAAVGLQLLFGLPLQVCGAITAVASYVVLGLQRRGRRPFEAAMTGLLLIVAGGFGYDVVTLGGQQASEVAAGLLPRLGDGSTTAIAVGIVGATVMPHAIYLHSALTAERATMRTEQDRRHALRFLRVDCGLGLGAAAVVNVLMLLLAARLFGGRGGDGSIVTAHAELARFVGGGAALAFAVALLASGLASSSAGTYAGQVVMQGFVDIHVPLWLRRTVTMTPALVVLCSGVPITTVLTVSQDVLSFGIPFALIPLVVVTSRRHIMGSWVNRPATTLAAIVACSVVIALNAVLLIEVFR